MKRTLWILCFATLLPVMPSWAQGDSVFRDGKEWLQPSDFMGYTYEEVNHVCPGGVCSGNLQGSGVELTGYKWASISEVSALFNSYGVTPSFTASFQVRNDADAAAAIWKDFYPTDQLCGGDCPVGGTDFVAGIVLDPAPAGEPHYLAYVAGDDFFNTVPATTFGPADGVGVWLFRQVEDPPPIPQEDFIVNLEEPINTETHSGIGNLRGWAVAEDGIDRVEIYIDGEYAFDAPFGGWRSDVAGQYPEFPDSDRSGFSLAFGYSNLSVGQHTITARAFTAPGESMDSTSNFEVVAFHKDFINKWDIVDTSQATMIASGDEILLDNVSVDGQLYELRLKWRTAEQGFEIIDTGAETVIVDGNEWLQPSLFLNLSWNDINAVCPEGICSGVLNGYDMTGWTWASVDDVNALFNYYIGSDVLGPGPDGYGENDSEWAHSFFSDGWTRTGLFADFGRQIEGWIRDRKPGAEEEGLIAIIIDIFTEGNEVVKDNVTTAGDHIVSGALPVGAWFYRIP